MDRKKVFITGMGGYIAGALCRELDRLDWCEAVCGMDVKKPLYKWDKAEFRKMDINDPALAEWAAEIRPDVFIHLAFIVDPIPDEALMRRVNVDGTKNALAAAEKAGCSQVMVASSGTAYGAWPDNPVPLKESHPVRAHPSFQYAKEKTNIDLMCQEWAREHPEVATSIIRPCVVYGPLVNNYLSRLLTDLPVATAIRDFNPPLQFVHEDDVAGAIIAIIERGAAGAFNIAPPDTITIREAIEISGKRAVYLPVSVLRPAAGLMWKLQLPFLKAPPGFLDFMCWPWVMDSSRVQQETGYSFRYSSRETVEIMLRAKGVIEG